ncbi:hypothetical protein BC941DRAFT_515043 [Chlamydoabsidia padenii]|nr:hypothetical protein BC941DRAFT_515043 [Chlamydoabsidia padenii]
MNTTDSYFNLCSINLQQKINALAESFNAILAEAVEESINPQLLHAELLGTTVLPSRRKVHPWNAFFHEEAKGVKLNKESIASLKRKYDEASEEEKQGYCKRMSWGPVDQKKAANKISRDMAQSSMKLLDLGVQSLVLVASPGSVSTVRKGQSFALGDEAERFLLTSDTPRNYDEAVLYCCQQEHASQEEKIKSMCIVESLALQPIAITDSQGALGVQCLPEVVSDLENFINMSPYNTLLSQRNYVEISEHVCNLLNSDWEFFPQFPGAILINTGNNQAVILNTIEVYGRTKPVDISWTLANDSHDSCSGQPKALVADILCLFGPDDDTITILGNVGLNQKLEKLADGLKYLFGTANEVASKYITNTFSTFT